MADNDDLMIEVTGSSDKAASAIDKIIAKVTQMQEAIDKVTPSLSKFAERLDSITSGSKAFAMLDKLTKSTGDLSQASKKAEADEAMYQARLDRATVSMERSRVASEKLAAARQKAQEYAAIDAHNQSVFSMSPEEYKKNGYDHTAVSDNAPAEAWTPPDVGAPSMKYNSANIQAQMDAFTAKIEGKAPKINIDTEKATAEVRKIGEYIDGLTPKVSSMSAEAQEKFNSLAGSLNLVSQRIDNQRMMYSRLAAESEKVGNEKGEGSTAYLRLEKQMLSASSATERLTQQQEKLKQQLAEVGSESIKVGEDTEKASKKSNSAWDNTLRMMEKMFIRIAAFRIFSAISQGIVTGIQDMALASGQANTTMSALATNSLYLKNSVGAALMPVLQSLVPVLNQVTDAIANVFNGIAMLTARIFNHSETAVIASRASVNYAQTIDKTGDSASKANKKVKELQNSVLGFDELNKLSEPTTSTPASSKNKNPGMPAYGDMFKTVKVPGWVDNIGGITDQIGKVISKWWSGLTDAQKWGAGIGGTAGFIIGGIIGRLIGGPIGQVVGSVLGAAAGVAIGVWWASLTSKEKWSAGIGAGAGTIIGAIIGGLIGGKIGVIVGATLGAVAGALIGKWWADLTTPEKWSSGIGAGAGATIGGIIGGVLTGGNPIGIAVGIALGGTIGAIIGKWWSDLTVPQKWSAGIGAGVGTILGGIIGTLICPGIGTVVGMLLGGTAGSLIGKWWSELTTKQKWSTGIGAGAGAIIGGIIGTLICPGIGTVLGAALGGTLGSVAGRAIDNLTAPFRNIQWPSIQFPHINLPHLSISYDSSGWAADALKWFGLPGMPNLSVNWYAKGGFFDTPSVVGIGEAGPEAALPLNDKVFSQIAQGIVRNGGNNGNNSDHTEQILDRMDRLEDAIRSMKVALYTDDRTIAESADRGRTQIARQYHLAT